MQFESLENRQMYSASLANGVLTLTGTPGNDNFYLNYAPGSKIGVYEYGKPNVFFTTSAVKKIVANGGAGNDQIYIGLFDTKMLTVIDGGTGNDYLTGASGSDTILGGDGNDIISSGAGNDSVSAGAGNDTITGAYGNDTILGDDGNDLVSGGVGDDLLDGGLGGDRISGEEGTDTVTYASRTKSVFVDITNKYGEPADDGEAGEKDFVDYTIENVIGGSGNDKLVGTFSATKLPAGQSVNNVFVGNGGNDILDGLDGNDTLDGGAGRDTLLGGIGNDLFRSEDGEVDSIDGGAGTDVFGRITLNNKTEKAVDRITEADKVNDLVTNMED